MKKTKKTFKNPLTKGKKGGILHKPSKEGLKTRCPPRAPEKSLKTFEKGVDKREESVYNRKAVRYRRWIGWALIFEN
ncbi:MAG: hypothetical protein J6T24_00100, partial [Clostridia bacterium]|nr:hypothetical protein [Clostridia bacterium]